MTESISLSIVTVSSSEESTNDEESRSCPICYEPFEDDKHRTSDEMEALKPSTPSPHIPAGLSCDHTFCSSCLSQHCQLHLEQHHKLPIRCPERICQAPLTHETVQQILSTDEEKGCSYLAKYERLSRLANDPSLVTCPSCDQLVDPKTDQPIDRRHSSELQCSTCQEKFCCKHGKACGKFDSCLVFEQTLHFQSSERALQKHTRPCPRCGARIFKDAGCDHIVCPSCNEDFCWRCGKHEFLTGKLTRTCQKCHQSYIDHRLDHQHKFRTCLWLPFLIPFMLLWICLMGVLCTIALIICCFGACMIAIEDAVSAAEKKESSTVRVDGSLPSTAIPIPNDQARTPTGRDETFKMGSTVVFLLNVVFLPIAMFLHHLGYHNGFVDRLMAPDGQNKNGFMLEEIPTFDEDDDEENSEVRA